MTAFDKVESWIAGLGTSLIGLGFASEAKKEGWPLNSSGGLQVILSLILIYPIWRAVYNIYFHPLSSYPGPRFAAATKIPIAIASWNGDLAHWMLSLHEYYRSDIIRTSPDEVCVISASAWKDVYGQHGHASFPKDLGIFPGVENIFTANDADHGRQRRLLSHGFSDKALREQEPLLMSYVDKLVYGLQGQIDGIAKGKVDFSKWLMWTTFDIIGDLSLGRSFDCLTNEDNHQWLNTMMEALQSVVYLSVTLRFPPLAKLLLYCMPKSAREKRHSLEQFAIDRVDRRLESKTSRPDFLQYITKNNNLDPEKGSMTRPEIQRNASTFIVAGSETTATHLTVTLWLLTQYPQYHERLRNEIRTNFASAEEISIQRIIDRLPFLQAVVNESFRVHPPAAGGQSRVAPTGGEIVSGHFIPEGTGIQLNQFAANRSHLNFAEPEAFAPERWIDSEKYGRWKNDQLKVVQPFSVGARNCIGRNLALAEIRLILTHLLYRFDIEPCDETDKQWTAQKIWLIWKTKPMIVKISNRAQ